MSTMPCPFRWYFFFLLISCQTSFSAPGLPLSSASVKETNALAAGIWKGEINRTDGHAIVFNFSVRQKEGKTVIEIINGAERLIVDNIRQKEDSVFIEMPFFNSFFALRILPGGELQGKWIKNYGDHLVALPFYAQFNIKERFPVAVAPRFDISGRWSVLFTGQQGKTESVGEFVQQGSMVTGTFLTTTGDYRYLQGVVSGDTLKLSTFDGGHAYSFESRILDTNKMEGFYYAGATSVESWVAVKDKNASLPDEYSQTRLKDSSEAVLHFQFPDLQGKMVSLADASFRNKVVVVQILGSWCPNCMDETGFLGPWYKENRNRGVEIVGLAYERSSSASEAKRLLQPFITRFHVSYPILTTGVTVGDSLRTQKTLPEIEQIIGFPTTIFIDKKGHVRKIDTGFNGPGTGIHYEEFKKNFNSLIDLLINE